jgi:hypothetical protein
MEEEEDEERKEQKISSWNVFEKNLQLALFVDDMDIFMVEGGKVHWNTKKREQHKIAEY